MNIDIEHFFGYLIPEHRSVEPMKEKKTFQSAGALKLFPSTQKGFRCT